MDLIDCVSRGSFYKEFSRLIICWTKFYCVASWALLLLFFEVTIPVQQLERLPYFSQHLTNVSMMSRHASSLYFLAAIKKNKSF